ncbi:MAG: CHAT domain-containing protein, partial [Phycisphaerae bacterium]
RTWRKRRTFSASARGGLDRAGFGGAPPPLWAAVRARLDRPRDAWQSLERYFARALLDEIQRRESQPLAPQELKREQQFIGLLDKLDERIAALRVRQNDNPDTAALADKLRNKRDGLLAEFTKLEASFQDKYGAAAGQVYALEQIRARLTADAALLMWLDTEGISHAVDPNGEHWACIVKKTQDPIWVKLRGSGKNNAWSPDDDRLPSKSRALLRDRKSTQAARKAGLDALRRQRLAPLEKHLDGINHLIVLPAGWMNGVPIEALTDDYTISYAPSGSMFAWLREKKRPSAVGGQPGAVSGETPASENQPKKASPRHTLLALGDPVFAVPSDAQPEPTEVAPPPQGILLALVQPGSNADAHGLQRGDVLMEYGGRALKTPADLGPAIQSAASNRTAAQRASKKEIPIRVWREGKTLDLTLAPGRMGVRAAQGPAAEAVLAMRRMDEALVRSGGSSFKPLPATRREVQAVSALFGDATTTLLGSEASEQKLAELAASGELRQYRYLHLATHGVLDDKRAMNSALILAQDNLPDPYEQYMSDKPIFDGRLTAKQIVRTWKLDADLVTLSACQTALGKQAGGEGMIGFSQALFAAGARSLVLSLWKVDDTATMLLMRRFYEN